MNELAALLDRLADHVAPRVAELVAERLEDRVAASPWLDLAGACAYLGMTKAALYKLTGAKPSPAIPLHRVGMRIWFERHELDAWLDEHYEGPPRTSTRLRAVG